MKLSDHISAIFLLLTTSVCVYAQGLMLNPTDSIYRYEAFLDEPIAIDRINPLKIDFPCVEVLSVNEEALTRGQILLTSETGLSERYSKKESGLELMGYNTRDPFLGLRNKEIVFLSPVDYGAFHKKLDSTGESLFLLTYSVKELPTDVAALDILNSAQSIQIEGVLRWQCRNIGDTRFYNLTGFEEGTFFQNDYVFEVTTIKIRKQKWQTLGPGEGPSLKSFFNTSKISFRNFFTESDALERVRITDYPYLSVLINLPREQLSLKNCDVKTSAIKVYPNPTYGDLNLLFESGQRGKYSFGIYNIIGKKLWETTIEVKGTPYKTALDIPDLSKGVYLYAITSPEGERIQSRRLVIVEP